MRGVLRNEPDTVSVNDPFLSHYRIDGLYSSCFGFSRKSLPTAHLFSMQKRLVRSKADCSQSLVLI